MRIALGLWIQVVFLTAQTNGLVPHNLMLLSQDSAETFEDIWDMIDGFNDGDVDSLSVEDLLSGGNFKAMIQDSWGAPVEFWLMFISERGYIMGEMEFDVTDADVNNLTEWFNNYRLMSWWPQPVSNKYVTMTARDGDRELCVTETESGDVWFTIQHNAFYHNPAIVLARNSSSLLSSLKVTGLLYEGCYPHSELSTTNMYTDTEAMTVDGCFVACDDSGHTHVAMHEGHTCTCANFVAGAQETDLPHMCTLDCPGDTTQNCGGTNTGYYAVYSGNINPGDLPDLASSSSTSTVLLINYTDTIDSHDSTDIIIANELDWDDLYVWVSMISVMAETIDDEYTQYWFTFASDDFQHEAYADVIGATPLEFPTNGTNVTIDVLPIRELTIHYNSPVIKSTVLLYGPGKSYVMVPHLALHGYFDEPPITSSTTISTSQQSSSTSTSSLTTSSSTSDSSSGTPTGSTLYSTFSSTVSESSTGSSPTSASPTSDTTSPSPTIVSSDYSVSSTLETSSYSSALGSESSTLQQSSSTLTSSLSTSSSTPVSSSGTPADSTLSTTLSSTVSESSTGSSSTSASPTSDTTSPPLTIVSSDSSVSSTLETSSYSLASGSESRTSQQSSSTLKSSLSTSASTPVSNSGTPAASTLSSTLSSNVSGSSTGSSSTSASPTIDTTSPSLTIVSSDSSVSSTLETSSYSSASGSETSTSQQSSSTLTSSLSTSSSTPVSSSGTPTDSTLSSTLSSNVSESSTASITTSTSPTSGSASPSTGASSTPEIASTSSASGSRSNNMVLVVSSEPPEAISPSTYSSSTTAVTATSDHVEYCLPNCSAALHINGKTYCPCVPASINNKTLDLDEIIEELIAELIIDETDVSAYTRKYTSAKDNRASAKTLGSLAIIILVAVIGCIVALDSASLVREIGRLKRNYKSLKRRLSRRSLKVNILEKIETQTESNISQAATSGHQELPTVSE